MSDPRATAFAAVEVFCESRVPHELLHEMRIECTRRGNTITIVERRAPWSAERAGDEWTSLKVAQLRFDTSSERWSLHWCDSNERWSLYDEVVPSIGVDSLLAELDADPTGIFWG